MHKFCIGWVIVDFPLLEIEWGVHGNFRGWREVSCSRRQSRAVTAAPPCAVTFQYFPAVDQSLSNFIYRICFPTVFVFVSLKSVLNIMSCNLSTIEKSGPGALRAIAYLWYYTVIQIHLSGILDPYHIQYSRWKIELPCLDRDYQKKLLDAYKVTCAEFLQVVNHNFELHESLFESHVRRSDSACLVMMSKSRSQLLHVSQDANRRQHLFCAASNSKET